MLGTPSYMAPEQAWGNSRQIGPAVDVYALGAILYKMLTGQPPFQGLTPLDTLDLVRWQEPVPPRRLQPKVPIDLESICLKCLHKEPRRRYASAELLAEDLHRFLSGEPTRARSVGNLERLWRWCLRNPLVAGLTTAVVLLVSAMAIGGVLTSLWYRQTANQEHDLRTTAEEAGQEATEQRRQRERSLLDTFTTLGVLADKQGEPAEALLWFAHAARSARQANEPERERVNQVRERTWQRQVYTPVQALDTRLPFFRGFAFHPGGRYLLAQSTGVDDPSQQSCLFDLEQEKQLPFPGGARHALSAAWSPDGSLLALGGRNGDIEHRQAAHARVSPVRALAQPGRPSRRFARARQWRFIWFWLPPGRPGCISGGRFG